MKRLWMILLSIALCCNAMARQERDTLGVGAAVAFVENRGQWESPFLYEAQLHNAALFLEAGSITVALREGVPHPTPHADIPRCHAYRMHFVGASASAPVGFSPLPTKNNYFLGSNPSHWQQGVPLYAAVRYNDLYEGIDLEVYGGREALKYNFVVHAGADVTQVVLEYEGTEGVTVARNGDLTIRTSVRAVVEMRPYVYQLGNDGAEVEVTSRWRVQRTKEGHYRATIEVGAYDHERDLVIDPVLLFSTYTGSTADNWGTTATYDSKKNVYTAGLVFGVGYPISLGVYQPTQSGNCDIGIFKFDSTGSQRIYATYLGGTLADMPHSLFVNSFDELVVFGTTGSTDFPVTPGAFQTHFQGGNGLNYMGSSTISFAQGSDIFVSRFSADGSQLMASTYVGGSGNDGLNYKSSYNSGYTHMWGNDTLYYNYGDGARGEVITDNLNNIYIGSTTFSNDFPTTSTCLQPSLRGNQDGVVLKIDYNLRNLLWSTYLGGSGDDAVYSIDVDSAYNLLVCGGTTSTDFPVTEGVYQPQYGGGSADGFVSKISYYGDRMMASSFLGRGNYDQLYFVRVGRHDEVFLFGQTKNPGTSLIQNAGYGVANAGMLLTHLTPDLTGVRWSTLFGTPGRINLSPTAFAADICNRVYAAGWGRDFVPYCTDWYTAGTTGMETTTNAYSSSTDGQDFYIISLSADANQMMYATFFGEAHQNGSSYNGADHVDGGTSRFDRMGTLYQSVCASCGGTQGFPSTAGVWSESNGSSNCNNALFRFKVNDDFPVAEFLLPQAGCAPYTLQFTSTGRGQTYHWDFGDGTTSTETHPWHTYSTPGTYTVTLVAQLPDGCSVADTQQHNVLVLGDTSIVHEDIVQCSNTSIQIGNMPVLGATYLWSGDPVSDSTVANPWVHGSGTYILHTSSPLGCTQVDTFHVHANTLIDQWLAEGVSCHDSSDGRAVFRLGESIDSDSIAVAINPSRPVGAYYTSGGRTYFAIDSLSGGITYHVTVDGYGCSYEQDIVLANPAPPTYEKEFTSYLCDDSCTGRIHIRYNMSFIPEEEIRDTLIEGLCPGTYITHLTSLGCPLIDTSTIRRDHSLDSLHAWADATQIYLGQSTRLHASDGGEQYRWSPAGDIDMPDSQHPTTTPTDTAVCYTVVATSVNGCTKSDSVCIHCTDIVCGAPEFTIPNAFTPNGDGWNDRLCFNADIVGEFSIAIYNRWGQCVYQSDDATQCWDGIFRNTPALAGVYTYTCHIRCHNGVETDLKGDITLIR